MGARIVRVRIDGYKRHILRDLDNGLVRAVGVTEANVAEASVTSAMPPAPLPRGATDLKHQPVKLAELHIDRAPLE